MSAIGSFAKDILTDNQHYTDGLMIPGMLAFFHISDLAMIVVGILALFALAFRTVHAERITRRTTTKTVSTPATPAHVAHVTTTKTSTTKIEPTWAP